MDNEEKEAAKRSVIVYAAVFSLFITVVVCLGAGWALDRVFGTTPWLVVGGIVVGAAVGFYQFIRLLSRVS